ncbi:MAG TPA: c-type cytochrome [Candidatus Sulfotelmatobacter sp.]|nr:c-type cytochrome [Candidatus Sulfotelmatobacter sp.]
MIRPVWLRAIIAVSLAGAIFAAVGDGEWLQKVPAKDRLRENPLAEDASAPLAGAKLFAEHCAQCHGSDAEGKNDIRHPRPSLHSARVKQAAPGELFWLLTNGSQKNGMPSWSRLPEPQRWQVISFLKSLQ